jgi:hypothetical protein
MIEKTIIDGKKASIQYLSGYREPSDKENAKFIQIMFDDGGSAFVQLTAQKVEGLSHTAIKE